MRLDISHYFFWNFHIHVELIWKHTLSSFVFWHLASCVWLTIYWWIVIYKGETVMRLLGSERLFGTIQKVCHSTRGRRIDQNDHKVWHRGYKPKSDVTNSKNSVSEIVILLINTFLLSPWHWHFHVVAHLDIKVCVVNMLIAANMGPKVQIKFRLILRSEFVTFWGVTRGEGVQDEWWQSVTWGEGVKNVDFLIDILFKWPLSRSSFKMQVGLIRCNISCYVISVWFHGHLKYCKLKSYGVQ